MDRQSCYTLFNVVNDNLEDVEYLTSLLINGLLDDSSLQVDTTGVGWACRLYIKLGNGINPVVDEDNLNQMVDLLNEERQFYLKNKAPINDFSLEGGRDLYHEYKKFSVDLHNKLLLLASQKVRKKYAKESAR